MGPVLLGLVAGLVAALGLTGLVRGLLYGVGPTDPLSIAVGVGILLIAAALAAYIPARRATRVDPMQVLRPES